ncbi:MAG: PAS domain S-box protein [Thermoplasmata archaeon]
MGDEMGTHGEGKGVAGSDESGKLFQKIFESASDGFAYLDMSGIILEVNPAAVSIFGGSQEELIGSHFAELGLFSSGDEETPLHGFEKALRGESTVQEIYITNKKGEGIDLECTASLTGPDHDQRVLVVVRDITKRKLAERALLESEEKYRAIFEQARDGVVLIDAGTGQIIDCNQEFSNQTGRSEEQLGKMKIWDVRPPKKRKSARGLFFEIAEKGVGGSKELEFQKPDGEIVSIDSVSRVVEIKGQRFVQSMSRDITERKNAEQALKDSEERLRLFMDSATDGFTLFDSELNLVDVNLATLGLDPRVRKEDIIGTHITRLIRDVKETGRYDKYREVMRTGEPWLFKNTFTHPELGETYLDVKAFKVGDGLGLISTDITEKEKSEQALRGSEEKYRNLVDNALVGIYQTTLKGNLLYVNEALAKTFEFDSPEEMISEGALPRYKDLEKRKVLLELLKNEGSVRDFEVEVLTRTGKTKHILVDAKLEGDVLSGMVVDITERKKAEETLSKRTYDLGERYKELNCLYTISKLAEVSDLSLDELIQGIVDIIPPSLQYPEITSASIELDDTEFSIGTTREAVSAMSSDIFLDDKKVGNVSVSYTEERPPEDEGPFFSEERALINAIAEELGRIFEQRQAQDELKRIGWLLRPRSVSEVPPEPSYGDLTRLNSSRLILESVGKDILSDITSDYLGLLESSAAVYESNGDYALGICSSNWCRFLDNASRELCKTEDNREAMENGKWLCHESCWNDASKVSIETGLPTDVECNGGIRLHAVPIHGGGKIVGSVNFGYGDPPTDPGMLMQIAKKYAVPVEELQELAASYESRPRFIIDVAKSRLQAQAGLIGEIIERKQTEDELRRSEERFKIMFDYAPDAYVLTDQEGVFIDGNRAAEELLGFTKDEVLGKNLLDLEAISEDWIEGAVENLMKAIKGQSTGPDEVELTSKEGEKVVVETRTYPVRIDGQDMMLATARDITEQKRVEEAKNNLLSNISHELRTPLTSIEGYTKFVLSGKLGEVPEKLEKCLNVIDEESDRLKTLIDNFLDLMTIDAEGLRMKLRQIAVPEVIDSLISSLNLQLEMKGVSFTTDITPDMGFIWGDENRLHQLFSNLLSNAIKFTPRGGSIKIRSREEDSKIIVEVEDTGVGIPANELPHVFSRFYMVDASPSRKYGGVGLGLAICNEIVEAHGGHMEVESEVGKGTIFRVELPKYSEVLHGEKEDSGG